MAGVLTLEQMGKYELVRQLSTGRMAHVFLAVVGNASGFPKRVLVKRLHREWTDDPRVREAFLTPARAAAGLDHPNVGKVLETGIAEGMAYVASQYVWGPSLRQLLAFSRGSGKPIPFPLYAKIISRVCAGLEYAHAQDAVHGHLDAGQIVIDQNGGVKIMGWGMAPDGAPVDQHPGADIAGLGTMLRELLSAQEPSGLVPEALQRITERRYASGASMQADLERFISASGQSPGDGELVYLVGRWFFTTTAAPP